jgi:hypothetical protein
MKMKLNKPKSETGMNVNCDSCGRKDLTSDSSTT